MPLFVPQGERGDYGKAEYSLMSELQRQGHLSLYVA